MPAAELTTDFLQRCPRCLPSDVHGQLTRERKNLSVAAHLQIRVAQFAQAFTICATRALPSWPRDKPANRP
jgi:hypothetical protein